MPTYVVTVIGKIDRGPLWTNMDGQSGNPVILDVTPVDNRSLVLRTRDISPEVAFALALGLRCAVGHDNVSWVEARGDKQFRL